MATSSQFENPGYTAPHQYLASRDAKAASSSRGGRVKAHPWRAHNPGWLKSSVHREHAIAPVHSRLVRA